MKLWNILFLVAFVDAMSLKVPFTNHTQVLISENDDRIIGGKEASKNAYPFMARVITIYENNMAALCGGTLINKQWVMTAAHCVYNLKTQEYWKKVIVHLGDHNTKIKESTEQEIESRDVKIPKSYISRGENDIALIKLSSPAKKTVAVKRGCLSSPGSDYTGKIARAIGWGAMGTDASTSHVLKEADMPIVKSNECPANYDVKKMICTGFRKKSGEDTVYKGDSGGPLFVTNSKGGRTIIGVASFVTLKGETHKTVTSAVFTRVTAQLPWIQSYTNDLCFG